MLFHAADSDNGLRTNANFIVKSWIEISSAHLRSNIASIQTAAGPAYDLLGVIKANAYGHGAALCAPVLVEAGLHWLGVADVDEGTRVRAALDAATNNPGGDDTHIVVMCGFEPADAPGLVHARLTPVVWTPAHIASLEQAAMKAQRQVPVHLEIDTGMARQGAAPGAPLAAVLAELRRSPHVHLEGAFSHLNSSEVAGATETTRQQQLLAQAFSQMCANTQAPAYFHLGNSSAVDEGSSLIWLRNETGGRNEGKQNLLVRPGLALYGYVLPLEISRTTANPVRALLASSLRRVATWRTRILGLREIAAGDPVGYGATFHAKHPTRLALLPIGYADGFRREASSGLGDGWVMIRGRRAPIVGRVSMNLTVVDVTHHPPLAEGEEVVLLGEGVTAADHARWAGTIPYEILCGMRGHRRLI